VNRVSLLLLVATAAFGVTGTPLASQRTASEAGTTDIGDTEITTTGRHDTLRQAQEQWGVDATEYARYESLLAGPRGAFSVTNISPLEVLGIHARSPQERRQYADRLVRLMYEDTERVLAFEYEVQAAWKRLGRPMFDPAKLPRSGGTIPEITDTRGKRLALFVSTDPACTDCLPRTRALASRSDIAGLDIYVTNTSDANAIRAFARQAGIQPKSVISKQITLNQGSDLFALYGGNPNALPQTFVRNGKQLVPVSAVAASAQGEAP